MRFPCKFSRFVGGGGAALGSDTLPTTRVSPATADNCLASRIVSINGWPLSRIALIGFTTAVSPVAGSAQLYVFEDSLGVWVPLPCSAGASPTYTCGTASAPAAPIFFDAMSLIDLPHVQNDLTATSPGTTTFVLIMGAGTSPPNGRYDFALAPELTAKPF